MSFATTVKNELTTLNFTKTEQIALLAGFIRNNATYDGQMLCLSGENYNIITYSKKRILLYW